MKTTGENKTKKSLIEWIKEDICKDLRMWRGGLSGAAVGYVISYFFQPELLRAKMGFFGYIGNFIDILFSFGNRLSAQVAFTAWISVIIGATIGRVTEKKLIEKGKIQEWKRKNPREGEQGGHQS